ncbi:MAG: FKBP-type peptidyl-prolyl cis-trans isomerase N-terminal domain-containing protein [Pirellulaceae bacterium]
MALTACAAITWAQEPIKVIQPGAAKVADPASYGIGYDIGMQISQGGLKAEDLSKNDLLAGLIDALSGKDPAVRGRKWKLP